MMRINAFGFTLDKNQGAQVPATLHVNYTVQVDNDKTNWFLEVVAVRSHGTQIVHVPNAPPGHKFPKTVDKQEWGPGVPIGPVLDVPDAVPIGYTGDHTFEHVFDRASLIVPDIGDSYMMTVRLVPVPWPSNDKQFVLTDVNL